MHASNFINTLVFVCVNTLLLNQLQLFVFCVGKFCVEDYSY